MIKKTFLILTFGIIAQGCSNKIEPTDIVNSDIEIIESARQSVLENNLSGETKTWSGDKISGNITPIASFKDDNGKYCRRIIEHTYTNSKEIKIVSMWCKEKNKKWKYTPNY